MFLLLAHLLLLFSHIRWVYFTFLEYWIIGNAFIHKNGTCGLSSPYGAGACVARNYIPLREAHIEHHPRIGTLVYSNL
jgi:hypothetical protein